MEFFLDKQKKPQDYFIVSLTTQEQVGLGRYSIDNKIAEFIYLAKLYIPSTYYKYLKKGAHQSHLGRQKWAGFWQISLYIK